MVTRGTLISCLVALNAFAGGGGAIGYAQSTGYFKQDSRPTLYQPLNLLDGRDPTAWCSPTADPLTELISIGFVGPVRLDELRISTGNNFDEHTWGSFSRAKKLRIRSGKQSQTLELEDVRGAQPIALNPPMTGARFEIEVLDQYPADDPDQPVCLTDLIFVTDAKPLNGPWLTTRLKYDRPRSTLMGTWYSGFAHTPDRFLSFYFGGTFRFSFEPFDEKRATPKSFEGTYEVSGSRLVLEFAGKKHTLKFSRDAGKDAKSASLTLEGELTEELKGAWRSTP